MYRVAVRTEEELAELPPNEWFFRRRTPGVLFHIGVVLLSCGLLWAHSTPGLDFLLWLSVANLILVATLVWCVRLIAVARSDRRPAGSRRSFLIAPACGLVTLALIFAEVPLRARWAASRPAFEDAVERVLEDEDGIIRRDQRLDLYEVWDMKEDNGAVLFHAPGPVLDDAGFAYVPNGRFPSQFGETASFHHLGGPWYSWMLLF